MCSMSSIRDSADLFNSQSKLEIMLFLIWSIMNFLQVTYHSILSLQHRNNEYIERSLDVKNESPAPSLIICRLNIPLSVRVFWYMKRIVK